MSRVDKRVIITMIAASVVAGLAILASALTQPAAVSHLAARPDIPLPAPAAIPADALVIPTDCVGAAARGISAAEAINSALAEARAARARRPSVAIIIRFAPGLCRVTSPIMLTAADAGEPGAPLVLQGAPGGGSIITGAAPLAPAGPAPHDNILPAPARTAVRHFILPQADLARLAAETPRRSAAGPRPAALILIEGGRWLDIAHWPETGFAEAAGDPTQKGPNVSPAVNAPRAKTDLWSQEHHLSGGGYWSYDWLYEASPVAAVTPDGKVTFRPLSSRYAEGAKMLWKVLNSASDINHAGEYAVDPDAREVTVWPTSASDPIEAVEAAKLLTITGGHDIRLDHLTFRGALDTAVDVEGSSRVVISNSLVADIGAMGVMVNGGAEDIVWRTVVTDSAEEGIELRGGDAATLTGGGHAVIDSVLTRFALLTPAYRPGVKLTGVGLTVQGSLFEDSTSNAIMFAGNDHTIRGNEFADVVRGSIDMGAVYSGRNLLWRGTVVEDNFFHDIVWDPGPLAGAHGDFSPKAVYFDDFLSENRILRNVFYDLNDAILFNTGSNNEASENLFACLRPGAKPVALWVADSAGAWARLGFDVLVTRPDSAYAHFGVSPSARTLYGARYPGLAHSFSPAGGAPAGEVAVGNTIAGAGDYERVGRTEGNFAAVQRLPAAPCDLAGAARSDMLRRLIAGCGIVLADREAALRDLPYFTAGVGAAP